MRRRIFALVLAVVTLFSVCLLSACKKPEEEQEDLTQRMQSFVDAVKAIKTPITLSSGADIDAAYNAYAFLDSYERASKTVEKYKVILDGYQKEYSALKSSNPGGDTVDDEAKLVASFLSAVNAFPAVEDLTINDRTAINNALAIYNRLTSVSKQNADVINAYVKLQNADRYVQALEYQANRKKWQQDADDFVSAVADLDTITLDSADKLEDLMYQYNNFPDEVKKIGGVKEAKAVLDEKYAEYLVLRDEDDIEKFVAAVTKLGKGEITLDSEGAIRNAETIYRYMSDNAKGNASVISAYERLCDYRAQFDVLFAIAERERIDIFIAAANRIPTDIENVDITWYQVLADASKAYFALTSESMKLPEVVEAFNRWDAAQTVFDKKGYKKIPDFNMNIGFSGDTVPYILFLLFEDVTANVRSFYGVTNNRELQQKATLYLDVYVDGVYVTKTAIDMTTLENGFILKNVNTILKGLSSTNPEIVSGANFSFAAHIEDKNQAYIPTATTAVSAIKQYTW